MVQSCIIAHMCESKNREVSPVRLTPLAAPLLAAIVVFLSAATGAVWSQEFDPLKAVIGRWAVSVDDCVGNQYVWRFGRDRAALYIDNAITTREYAASWSREGHSVTLKIDREGGDATFVFEFLAPDEFVTAHLWLGPREIAIVRRVEGSVAPPVRQKWRRCPPF